MQLRCFVAIADAMNFRRAAQRLNMTQPPLTRQIQALEHEIGAALFDRSARAIRLTPAGAGFLRRAHQLLEQAAGAVRDARRIAGGDAGSLTLAFTAASSYAFLPRLVTRLGRQMPEVALSLREMVSAQQLQALQAGQIDLALIRPPVIRPGIEAIRVWREPLCLAMPAGHRLAIPAEVALADLTGEAFVTYPPVEGGYFHDLIMGLIHVAGAEPASIQHVTQTHSILALVGAGLGVALVPRSVERFVPADIVLRPLADVTTRAELWLAWQRDGQNPACRVAVELLRRPLDI